MTPEQDDYTDDDRHACPQCSHKPTRWRDCDSWCEEGLIDEHDDDPINFGRGSFVECRECFGTGSIHWCPKCGLDITAYDSANGRILP